MSCTEDKPTEHWAEIKFTGGGGRKRFVTSAIRLEQWFLHDVLVQRGKLLTCHLRRIDALSVTHAITKGLTEATSQASQGWRVAGLDIGYKICTRRACHGTYTMPVQKLLAKRWESQYARRLKTSANRNVMNQGLHCVACSCTK